MRAFPKEVMGGMDNNNIGVQKNWAIICPGPSLNKHQSFEHDPGCMIAVNGAILHSMVDWWAVTDEEVFNSVMAKVDLATPGIWQIRTKLWIPRFWVENADKRLLPVFHDFKRETWKNLTFEMTVGNGYPWRETTMFCAIALAILKGARKIRIYGADMAGKGYFAEGLENKRTRHVEKRWVDERYWFEHIVLACRAYYIDIERMIPNA